MDEVVFRPEDADARLASELRRISISRITDARSQPEGTRLAWEATLSYADFLLTMANADFKNAYVDIRRRSVKDATYPCRDLWRECNEEARRQGRLGEGSLPVSRDRWGLP